MLSSIILIGSFASYSLAFIWWQNVCLGTEYVRDPELNLKYLPNSPKQGGCLQVRILRYKIYTSTRIAIRKQVTASTVTSVEKLSCTAGGNHSLRVLYKANRDGL